MKIDGIKISVGDKIFYKGIGSYKKPVFFWKIINWVRVKFGKTPIMDKSENGIYRVTSGNWERNKNIATKEQSEPAKIDGVSPPFELDGLTPFEFDKNKCKHLSSNIQLVKKCNDWYLRMGLEKLLGFEIIKSHSYDLTNFRDTVDLRQIGNIMTELMPDEIGFTFYAVGSKEINDIVYSVLSHSTPNKIIHKKNNTQHP